MPRRFFFAYFSVSKPDEERIHRAPIRVRSRSQASSEGMLKLAAMPMTLVSSDLYLYGSIVATSARTKELVRPSSNAASTNQYSRVRFGSRKDRLTDS